MHNPNVTEIITGQVGITQSFFDFMGASLTQIVAFTILLALVIAFQTFTLIYWLFTTPIIETLSIALFKADTTAAFGGGHSCKVWSFLSN